MNFRNTLKTEKKPVLGAVFASSVITLVSLLGTGGSDSVLLFIFLEPVVLACIMPFLLGHDAPKKTTRVWHSFLECFIFCAALSVGALITGLFRGAVAQPLLSTLFFVPFAIFIAAVTTLLTLLIGFHLGQVAGASITTLLISTPFWISYVLKVAPQGARLFAVQSAVSVNPIIIASASILQFDWLRSPRMYSVCPIGGEQFPFYYPSPVKIGLIYLLCGFLLTGAGYFIARRAEHRAEENTAVQRQ